MTIGSLNCSTHCSFFPARWSWNIVVPSLWIEFLTFYLTSILLPSSWIESCTPAFPPSKMQSYFRILAFSPRSSRGKAWGQETKKMITIWILSLAMMNSYQEDLECMPASWTSKQKMYSRKHVFPSFGCPILLHLWINGPVCRLCPTRWRHGSQSHISSIDALVRPFSP